MSVLRFVTVEPVTFLYTVALQMEMVTIQSLFYTKTCLSILHPSNESYCLLKSNLTEVERETTVWMTYSDIFLNSLMFLGGLYAASWSDNFSRKFVMLIAPIGTAIAATINMMLSIYMDAHVAYFFISASISGITFGLVGLLSSTFGYLSDVVTEQSRTKRFVILETAAFSGSTVGSYIAGAVLKNTDIISYFNDYAKVFAIEASISALIVLYITIRIPFNSRPLESRPVRSISSVTIKQLFSLKHVQNAFKTVFRERSSYGRRKILLILLCIFFACWGLSIQFVLSFLYVKHLGWNVTKYSYYKAILSGVEGISMLLCIPVTFCINIHDYIIAAIGIISRGSGLFLLGLSTTDAMVYSTTALFLFSELFLPSMRSALSKIVEENEKGQIFAAVAIVQNLCFFSGSFVFLSIYRSTLSIFPGLCFELVAGLQVLAFVILVCLYLYRNHNSTPYAIMENECGVQEDVCPDRQNENELNNPAKS